MEHVVERGETFRDIAAGYGMSLTEFISANPDIDPDRIFPGQRLAVPQPPDVPNRPSAPPEDPPPTSYRVQSGDRLSEIARAHETTVTSIVAANPGLDPDRIFPGQELSIPGNGGPTRQTTPEKDEEPPRRRKATEQGPQPKAGRRKKKREKRRQRPDESAPHDAGKQDEPAATYAVQPGDSLKSIAAELGMSLRKLIDLNPQIDDPNVIRAGQVLNVLPGGADEPSPPPARRPRRPPDAATRDWAAEPIEARLTYVIERLVERGYPVNGAAGIVGNLYYESGVLPNRVQGSSPANPMRSKNFDDEVTDFTPAQIMNRDADAKRGPKLGGIGLAQWTWPSRRRRLFEYEYGGRILGPDILFDMDAQIDFLVSELSSSTYEPVERVVRDRKVSVHDAADAVLYGFERPASVIGEDGKLLPRTDPAVQEVFNQRRAMADRALAAYTAAQD